MRRVLLRMLDALFPRDTARAARRAGLVCLLLAITVAVLFPVSAGAGTEVPVARWTTTAALAVAWIALRWSRGRIAWIAAGESALVVCGLLAPATWLLWLAALAAAYVFAASVPRPWPAGAAIHSPLAPLSVAAEVAVGLTGGGDPRFGRAIVGTDDEDPPLEAAQEILESIGIALVLALVVREFGFEAFKIPTGSMEPTILGDAAHPKRDGDRLLAFKPTTYRRYDIVVFRFPLFRGTNYIKRLIGLPGEHVEIRDGDVYAGPDRDRMAIAPKPDDVQAVMWRVEDRPEDDDDWVDLFEREEGGAWVARTGSAEVDVPGDGTSGVTSWVQLRGSYEEDQRISFDAEVRRPGGELLISLEGGQRRCELRLGQDGAEVSLPGGEVWKPDVPGLAALGSKFRIGFSVADRIARIHVNGRQVAAHQHEDVTNGGLDGGRVRLGARGLSAVLRKLVVESDVQYTTGSDKMTSWDIQPGHYVMLGDNTTSSQDSRYWRAYVVRTKAGDVYVAPETARLTEDSYPKPTWHEEADAYVFLDSYGIRRRVLKSEVADRPQLEHQPFVREEDLVGRAFLIFWPFPPAGDFRPRLLR